jgi:hypothetical protein
MAAPAAAVLAGVAVVPVLAAVWLSLHRSIVIFHEQRFIGLGNFRFLIADGRFWSALGTTAYFTLVAVAVELLLGLPIAFLLHRGHGLRVFQAASTSCSRSAERPARGFLRRSSGRPFQNVSVSFAVSSAGRNRKPAPIALLQLIWEKPPSAPVQTGMSSHAETLCSVRNFSDTQTSVESREAALRQEASIAAIVSCLSGPVALYTPTCPRSMVCTIQAARSRTSTYWTGSSPVPGASTSPPRSRRTGQYV